MVAALRFLGLVSCLVRIVSAGSPDYLTDMVNRAPKCSMPCMIEAVAANGCNRELADQVRLADCVCSSKNTEALSTANICVQKRCKWDDALAAMNATLGTLCHDRYKESRGYLIRIVAIIALTLTIPVVTLRILSRLYCSGRLWCDDYTSIAATMVLITMLTLQFRSADLGFGRHSWFVDTDVAYDLLRYYWAGQQLYIVVQVFAKISILILYMRLFQAVWFQWAVKGGIVFMMLHGVVFTFLIIFQCLPISGSWDPLVQAKCLDFRAITYAGAALSVAEDFVLVLMPIPEMRTMKLNWRKAIGLSFMFGFGLLATATSILRMRYLIQLWDTYDPGWDRVDPILWSVMEQFSAIICGSLPSCRAIVIAMMPKIRARFLGPNGGLNTDILRSRPGVFRLAPQEKKGGGFFNARRGADLAEHQFRVAHGPEPGLPVVEERKPAGRGAPRDPYADLYDLDDETTMDCGGGEACDDATCPCALSPGLCRTSTRRTSIGAQPNDPGMVAVQIRSPHEVLSLTKRGSSAIRPVSMMTMTAPSIAGSSIDSHSIEFFDAEKYAGLRPPPGWPLVPAAEARVSRAPRPEDPNMVSYRIRSPEEVVELSRRLPSIRPYSLAPTTYLGDSDGSSIGRAVSCGTWSIMGAAREENGGSCTPSLAVPDEYELTRIYTSSSDEADPDERQPQTPSISTMAETPRIVVEAAETLSRLSSATDGGV
ncbi:hypothetical protein MAPG_04928 [Magnaporthiopsis poae ATCC 64411]|uniref:CFEM domain-containing protein n=1 Tax=Magnaporthiopsis poae (strain ATCC 64411 / 73-15) TaxID=644358 RepID=A0A0C4DY19_MAGP6|nr:hypothetical protein MAPG_04928 [Magnaporthiopsis poae ATCC 64411]